MLAARKLPQTEASQESDDILSCSDESQMLWLEGLSAGQRGFEKSDCPYPAGGSRFFYWSIGWKDSQDPRFTEAPDPVKSLKHTFRENNGFRK